MKRLLLIGLVGLSLVGCSNNVDYSQTEIPTQDTKPTLEEQRKELQGKVREEKQETEQYTTCTIGGTGTTLAKSVARCATTMKEIENVLQHYSKHKSGAYDSMTWNLGDNVTVTARYIPNLGLQVTAEDGAQLLQQMGMLNNTLYRN